MSPQKFRRGINFSAFLLLAVFLVSNRAGAEGDNLIVPAERMGPIHLGQTLSELESAFGKPTVSNPAELGLLNYCYESIGLCVVTGNIQSIDKTSDTPDTPITGISTRNSLYLTKEEIGVGSAEEEARNKYGKPDVDTCGDNGNCVWIYLAPGITFYWDKTSRRIFEVQIP